MKHQWFKSLALKVLPNSFAEKPSKEIYFNFFWLLNASVQLAIFVVIFPLYFYWLPNHKSVAIVLMASIALSATSIGQFYRQKKLTGASLRYVYLATLGPLLFQPDEGHGGLDFSVLWLLAAHAFGAYTLRRRETAFWTTVVILSYFFLQMHPPTWVDEQQFSLLRIENSIHFALITIVLTLQISLYRFINEQNEHELIDAKKEALGHLEENKSLVRILVHDVANPITVIDGMLRIHQTKLASANKYVDRSIDAAKRIMDILNDVKLLQKLRDSAADIEGHSFDLKGSVQNLRVIFEERMKAKNIEIELQLDRVWGLGNESLFSNQVVANLLSNAIKFTPLRGHIRISTFARGDLVICQVADSGVGIPPQILNSLFDVTADTTRPGTQGEQGTGFGLPIVKTIVNKMKGDLTVRTTCDSEKSGSVFEVSLQRGRPLDLGTTAAQTRPSA